MPKGVPVATFAIGNAGAANAALFAIAMLAVSDPALRAQLDAFREKQTQAAQAMTLPPPEADPVSPFTPQGGGAL
jgi:5-(carboxyamino)imidazole ribonucleotide mutase